MEAATKEEVGIHKRTVLLHLGEKWVTSTWRADSRTFDGLPHMCLWQ